MASFPSEETNVKESGSDHGQTGGDQTEKDIKHRFSEPWEDSDLILVVEDEKFHVHRLILGMNSPVFKAMFKSQFKEATSSEIPLPGKMANEVLDFLKRVYFQHNQEPMETTIENVEHLLKLSDEYQVKHIFDPCIIFVENEPKTKDNVMKIRKMAEMYNLNSVREDCDDLLKNMKLKTLSETVHLEDLDLENVRHFLEQRIERLETFLDELYPEFMGMVECLVWLLKTHEHRVNWCPQHVSEGGQLNFRLNIDNREIRECSRCNNMLESVVCTTFKTKYYGKRVYHYGDHSGSHHFQSLAADIDEFFKLKHG